MYNSVEETCDYFKIPNKYSLVWDDKNPDYVIASEWIYRDKKYYQQFLSLQNERTINIFFAGEAMSPDLNFFDYAVVFDKNLSCDDRIIRMPTVDFFKKRLTSNFWKTCKNPKEELNKKTAFCNFIYTNANAHPRRDELFYKLSEYKKVDALGTHLRNVALTEKFVDEKIKRNYKFTIACENATYKGYASEKLLTALQAYTIPIYWGDPSIAEFLNPRRFINTNDMSLDEVLETVKKIDNDDKLWCQMVSEPIMTKEQEQKYQQGHKAYLDFWDHLFGQDLKQAKRLGKGTYPDMYRQFMAALIKPDNDLKVKKKKYLFGLITKKIKGSKRTIKFLGIKIFSYTHIPPHATKKMTKNIDASKLFELKEKAHENPSKFLSQYENFLGQYGAWIGADSTFKGIPVFPHKFYGIFISNGAKIGKNCTIFQQVTIGSNNLQDSPHKGCPIIGDNVYIGAGAKIIGKCTVGNNVRIGANAVVVKDVPDNTIVVNQECRYITKQNICNNFIALGKEKSPSNK